MIDLLVPVASACSATAWCLAQFLIHNYMIARWPKSAQDAVWTGKPDALVSGILIPLLGKAKTCPRRREPKRPLAIREWYRGRGLVHLIRNDGG